LVKQAKAAEAEKNQIKSQNAKPSTGALFGL
jgi:hypothetical protein